MVRCQVTFHCTSTHADSMFKGVKGPVQAIRLDATPQTQPPRAPGQPPWTPASPLKYVHCALGSRVQDTLLSARSADSRPCAGLQSFLITYTAIVLLTFWHPVLPLFWVADHFLELLTGAVILSVSLSITLYTSSFHKRAVLAASGTSGCPPYDFWMGRELNPRVFGVDLKEFCELYPGLIGWAVLNLAFAHKQLVETGRVRTLLCLLRPGRMPSPPGKPPPRTT
jgi:Ergosterol biosynthesis ERG4/ERG24 family